VSTDPTDLTAAIGRRVRDERLSRDWSLDRLATVAGLSRRVVINVEQGTTNPSVSTLLSISTALGIGLPALVEPPRTAPIRVTRSGEGAELWAGDRGGRGILVATATSQDAIELWQWTLGPHETKASDAHSAGTKELLHIHDGSVVVTVGAEQFTLRPGDAISIPGDVAHAYANPYDQTARFSLVVFEPLAGAQHQAGEK
jgi:transcriptional regulator with XRE-family HTH domain